MIGVLTSVAGLYYYLRVVVYVYMVPQSKPEPVSGDHLIAAGIALASCAALVLWMGIQPDTFARFAQSATSSFAR